MLHCFFPGDRSNLQHQVEEFWSSEGDALACFSVRSGFDLLLQTLALPPGSEVLMSAMNVKAMTRVVKRNGLVPVPVDLNLDSMGPTIESLTRAISPATRVLVVAHLFGTRLPLEPLLEVAKRHNLLFVEDCAQAFVGQGYTGHPSADVSMFSFGPIKFATALGGALLCVRDPQLLQQMRRRQALYPVQTKRSYLLRLLKFAGLKVVVSRLVFDALTKIARLLKWEYEDAISDAARGVARLGSAKQLRYQPSSPLLAVLLRRLRRWQNSDLDARAHAGAMLVRYLANAVVCPGLHNPMHRYWVFPILADDPPAIHAALRQAGFYSASLTRSETVAPPEDRPDLDAVVAKQALAKLVVLPCYQSMPPEELRRQAEVVKGAVEASRRAHAAGGEYDAAS